jgi:hypothetical protein
LTLALVAALPAVASEGARSLPAPPAIVHCLE